MKKTDVTEAIILAKKARNLSWEAIAAEVGTSPVWTTSACLGMNSMPEDKAKVISELLDLPAGGSESLMNSPTKT